MFSIFDFGSSNQFGKSNKKLKSGWARLSGSQRVHLHAPALQDPGHIYHAHRVTVSSGRRRDRPSRHSTTRSPIFRGAVRVPPLALHIEGNALHALLCYARPAPDAPESQSPPVSSVLNACPRRVKSSLAFPHHRVSACAGTGPGEQPSR
jgi:hypothetical protein